jgi:uncharacterized protein (DUF2249 family)
VIRPDDRVSQVLAREPALVEVFVAASPHFERLRSGPMRRALARLVTVEQAARVAGVDPAALLVRLNEALGEATPPTAEATGSATFNPEEGMYTLQGELPPVLAEIPEERVFDLDVREDLRLGREPFSRVMGARADLPAGHVLRIRAIFEPAPLYRVMAKHGFAHWTERLADDDWRVWFYPTEAAAAPEPPTGGEGAPEAPVDTVVLDVRGLEPPEPMARTLAALERLPAGATLVQVNVRVPQFLLPRLEELGFEYEIREQSQELVRIFIRRRDER